MGTIPVLQGRGHVTGSWQRTCHGVEMSGRGE